MNTTHLITTITCAAFMTTISGTTASFAAEHLGSADGFTIFTIEGFEANNTFYTGRVAVGGPATYNTVGIGSELVNSNGERDDLIVAGNLTWIGGDNFNGNIQVTGSTNLQNVDVPNGTVGDAVSIDFSEAAGELQGISDTILAIPANGQVLKQASHLKLTGTHETLNVFLVNKVFLHQLDAITIDVPEGSSVLVNISAQTAQFRWIEFTLIGCDASHVLFNLPDTTEIQLTDLAWYGTILAPGANILFSDGSVYGALICRSVKGNGESHHAPFVGYCDCDCHDDDSTTTCVDCDCHNPNADSLFD